MISGSKGEMWIALWILPFVFVDSLSVISRPVQSILLLKLFANHCVLPYAIDRKNDWRRIYTAREKVRNRQMIKQSLDKCQVSFFFGPKKKCQVRF